MTRAKVFPLDTRVWFRGERVLRLRLYFIVGLIDVVAYFAIKRPGEMKAVGLLLVVSSLISCSYTGKTASTLADAHEFRTMCPDGEYVATKSYKIYKNKSGSVVTPSQRSMTHAHLLQDAQRDYGPDVTVINLRYDMSKNKRIGVTFDIVRCN